MSPGKLRLTKSPTGPSQTPLSVAILTMSSPHTTELTSCKEALTSKIGSLSMDIIHAMEKYVWLLEAESHISTV